VNANSTVKEQINDIVSLAKSNYRLPQIQKIGNESKSEAEAAHRTAVVPFLALQAFDRMKTQFSKKDLYVVQKLICYYCKHKFFTEDNMMKEDEVRREIYKSILTSTLSLTVAKDLVFHVSSS